MPPGTGLGIASRLARVPIADYRSSRTCRHRARNSLRLAGSKRCHVGKNQMIGLLQRVSSAEVRVRERAIAKIGRGLLILVGVEKDDTENSARRLAERLAGYRVFPDSN